MKNVTKNNATKAIDTLVANKLVSFAYESTDYWRAIRLMKASLRNYVDDLNSEGRIEAKDEFYQEEDGF